MLGGCATEVIIKDPKKFHPRARVQSFGYLRHIAPLHPSICHEQFLARALGYVELCGPPDPPTHTHHPPTHTSPQHTLPPNTPYRLLSDIEASARSLDPAANMAASQGLVLMTIFATSLASGSSPIHLHCFICEYNLFCVVNALETLF